MGRAKESLNSRICKNRIDGQFALFARSSQVIQQDLLNHGMDAKLTLRCGLVDRQSTLASAIPVHIPVDVNVLFLLVNHL